jgi:PiT family inorganic phosphate transporter
MPLELIALVALALLYAYLNGVLDSSNLVSTVIKSRALSGRSALLLTAVAVFIGPFVIGGAVANTVGSLIDAEAVSLEILLAALISAIGWGVGAWALGIPSSSSHALVGGIIGATMAGASFDALNLNALGTVLIALFFSPAAGLLVGFLITRLVFFLSRNATPKINYFFKRAQVFTSLFLAFIYGANDAQKIMGVITLGLLTYGSIRSFHVPDWVVFVSALGIALGSGSGGYRLIHKMGGFFKIKPVDGFCAQLSADLIVLSASLLGGPVSTTQVVSTSIIGVGAAERINKVRWGVARDITTAWVLTIPATAVFAALIYWLIVSIQSMGG